MIRNLKTHFAINPKLDTDTIRSKFTRTNRHLTTANAGQIIPIYVDEMYPADTFKMDIASFVRQATPIHATMDNMFLDTYTFFVPYRLIWDNFKKFMGEDTTTAYETQPEYTIPQITAPASTGWTKGTLADYMGLPTGVPGISVSALPFRAYAKIYNDWFRDENLINEAYINYDDATIAGSNGSTMETDIQKGGMPALAAKLPDYFTTCLPFQQKGPDVLLPLGTTAPVITQNEEVQTGSAKPLKFRNTDGTVSSGQIIKTYESNAGSLTYPGQIEKYVYPSNLVTDLTNATAATIIALRKAFAIQAFYEKDARGGTRYIEIIQNHFGVTSSDARLQRPEYIGGKRINLNMQQVVQTSATDEVTPQGNISGYSVTADREQSNTYSAEEHGIYMVLAVIRYDHSYQQGIERFWSEKDKFDKYWTTFNGIGDQAVLVKEIYATGTAADEEVFGYQERYGHLRYKPNRISGAFRSNYDQSLDAWHLGDYYNSQPILGQTWIQEDKNNVDRTLAVQSEVENQFLMDFYFKNECIRPMPAYSIPGMRSYL